METDDVQDLWSATFGSRAPLTRFPLHKSVVVGHAPLVRLLLSAENRRKYNVKIDERDAHGNTPLFLACHFRFLDIVQILLEHGADPVYKSASGWSCLQHSIAWGDEKIARVMLEATTKKLQTMYRSRIPRLVKELEKFPDFACKIHWEFKSWIPFLSSLCPSDTYSVWKKGCCFRVDTTLVGFQGRSWQRGNISLLFKGRDAELPDVVMLDHDKKVVEFAIDSMKSQSDEEKEKGFQEMMKQPQMASVLALTSEVTFTPARGWFGGLKSEVVAGYDSQLINMDNLVYRIDIRKKDKSKYDQLRTSETPSLPSDYWETELEGDPRDYPLLLPWETHSQKRKQFKSTVAFSKEFPHSVDELIPIFEMLAPSQRHFSKLKDFLQLLPEHGFPLKMELPIFPAIAAVVSFVEYERPQIPDETFAIPLDYNKTKIKLEFDFEEAEEELLQNDELYTTQDDYDETVGLL